MDSLARASGSFASARVLLKARPTRTQLADRLRPPLPEGLELYLDVADISGSDWLERLLRLIGAHALPGGFVWVVEGPLRSLDGGFFDLAREADADREVLTRIVDCAVQLGAQAVVIHCIALAPAAELTLANRERALARAEALLAHYSRLCQERGLVPTIENVPPVLRMRESRFVHSLIGMAAEDLIHFADRLPGLRLTCDTSHAQLYINAAAADAARLPPELAGIARYVATPEAPRSLAEYVERLGKRIYEAHISNAAGLLDEGLPYGEGEADLDDAVARLLRYARYLVTEPIEPQPDRADRMREVAARILAVRERMAREGEGQ